MMCCGIFNFGTLLINLYLKILILILILVGLTARQSYLCCILFLRRPMCVFSVPLSLCKLITRRASNLKFSLHHLFPKNFECSVPSKFSGLVSGSFFFCSPLIYILMKDVPQRCAYYLCKLYIQVLYLVLISITLARIAFKDEP